MGDIDDCPIFALRGNLLAAAVALILLGRHIIARLCGALAPWSKPIRLVSGFEHEKAVDYVERWPCRLWDDDDDPTTVDLMPNRGPAMLSSLCGADRFDVIAGDRSSIWQGDIVDFLPLL